MDNSGAKMGDSPEESSWTFYIEGFMCQNNNVDEQSISSSYFSEYEESPSLVTDAASSAVKKGIGFSNSGKSNSNIRNNIICKQNSFKKHKSKVMCSMVDLELEDTASSPVNSPKMSYMNQFMNHKEKGKLDVSEVKRNIFSKGTKVFTGDRKGY